MMFEVVLGNSTSDSGEVCTPVAGTRLGLR